EKPASKQEANAPAAPTPAPVEATVPRPESKPDAQASVRPEPKPEAPAAAAKREPMLPKAGAGDTRSEQARREAEKRNASILRRPGSRDEGKAQRAEGPTISSGAEPQRASPRVVYPGPGAPAPQQATPPAE
ncbi:MAG: hypothetical protein K2Y29_10755, partial [Beijerinckiaceae bacterium]|nr:hypothetical protein [Beijerinckiaceae bacterium]